MGARPGLSDRRSRPRGRDGLFLPLRPYAEHRRHDGLNLCEPEGSMGAHRLRRVDASGAVFADVPGRSHAAGRRRGLPDGAGAGCGALSGVPDGGCCEKDSAMAPARCGSSVRRISGLCLVPRPVRLAGGQRGPFQYHARPQKRVHHAGCAAGLFDRVHCR